MSAIRSLTGVDRTRSGQPISVENDPRLTSLDGAGLIRSVSEFIATGLRCVNEGYRSLGFPLS